MIAIPKGAKNADLATQFINWELTDEAQLEGLAKNLILPVALRSGRQQVLPGRAALHHDGEAVGIGQTPYAFHFNDMVNADQSPWLTMLQTAVFDGDIDGAIATGAARPMLEIAAQ